MLEITTIGDGQDGLGPADALERGALEERRSEEEQEQEVGDFTRRHVLEKDAVFFEG